MTDESTQPYRILVVEQQGKGQSKIRGIGRYAPQNWVLDTFEVTNSLPLVIDDSRPYLPEKIEADLVLDYLKHPDLSLDLARMCHEKEIPVIASGRKILSQWAWTPPVCCALPKGAACGLYGAYFGYPEFDVELQGETIRTVLVKRGAPCGATWQAAESLSGVPAEEALEKIGLRVQFACTADPAGWDPIKGKSPVHLAADIHRAALRLAVIKARRE